MSANMEWQQQAACSDLDAHDLDATFFPHPNDQALDAKSICIDCPVAEQCLIFALETKQEHGVWGCMTAHERAQLLAKGTTKRTNPPTIHPNRCGTYSGVSRHRKLNEQFCQECRDARNDYEGDRKKRQRAARRLEQAS